MQEIQQKQLKTLLSPRVPESNKNNFGRVLAICGCRGYTGAAYFAAQGAVRFSFSWFNTETEVDAAIRAVRELAGS